MGWGWGWGWGWDEILGETYDVIEFSSFWWYKMLYGVG